MQLNPFAVFNRFEKILWLSSLAVIICAFTITKGSSMPVLPASLVGVTALVYTARGNIFGQVLCVIFSILYAIVSYSFSYYGEMVTYLGMTMPVAAASIFTWRKNMHDKNEVKVARMTKKLFWALVSAVILVTAVFYFILKALETPNLAVSTISISTSFLACFLLCFRHPAYAIAYAANDIILIILWIYAAWADISYISMVICFSVFFINDIYGFYSWSKRKRRQEAAQKTEKPHCPKDISNREA